MPSTVLSHNTSSTINGVPAAEGWLKLYPDDGMDQARREAYIHELEVLVDSAWDSYGRFRRKVKNRLQL
jgi:hypothetical protein